MRKIFTRCIFATFSLLLVASLSNAQLKPETAAVKGHLVRTTPRLGDIDNTTMYGAPLLITRTSEGPIMKGRHQEETEERLEEEMRERILRQYNAAMRGQSPTPPPVQSPLQTPTTTLGVNFDGDNSPGLQPSDNNMAAGPNHVIQIVNNTSGSRYRIWNKSGTPLANGILSALTGFSGSGDPIVLYDQLADRWFMAEFGPSACCSQLIIAVSTTPDPLGTWKIYEYTDASFFPDYPKFAVWHNAYYAYTNDFNSAGTAFLGTSVWAFDRTAMLAGNATAQMVRQRINIPNMIAMGVVTLEGMTPSTQNGLFLVPSSSTQMGVFEVTPNFTTPSITVGAVTNMTVNAWSTAGSIPQQTGSNLGSLSPRMMFRVNYRNNGGTESIVAAHTIANGALGQVRWYEFRKAGPNWTIYQQGNVAGTDGNSRWMPGISMDGCGNIALMYDVAGKGSPQTHPSIRYTGRNSADPINSMTLPESVIINSPSGFGGFRWGDYNTVVQDYSAAGTPTNGSFWATSQYGNQSTRVANFTLTGGCAAAPLINLGTVSLTAEACVPNNSAIDPQELVTYNIQLVNNGTSPTTNLVATLQASGGIIPVTTSQNYGVIASGGGTATQAFTFNNSSSICGSSITLTLTLQDGATNLGSVTQSFTLGATNNVASENFDAVVAPALPAGWVASNASGSTLWVTSAASPFSAPNAAFIDNPSTLSDKRLETPSFVPGTGAKINFRNNFATENNFDGAVLEISINGGAYQDIIAAGGSFTAGGYNGTVSSTFGNPLGGRQAWTGNSGGYIVTTANLPGAAIGQPCKLRFRIGTDGSVAATGWRVDDFTVSQPACCGAACVITCPANMTVNAAPGQCGANVTLPTPTTTGLCGPVTLTPASGSFFPVGTTTVTATTAAGPSCTFTVTVVDNTPPTITCPAPITVNNTPGLCSAVVNYPLPTASDNCAPQTPVSIQQTASQVPVAGSVSCNAGGIHTDNSYWRAYNLAPLALSGAMNVNSIQVGVEQAVAGSGGAQPGVIRLYTQTTGTFPGGTRTLVYTQNFSIPDQNLSTMTVPMAAPPSVPANAVLIVELFTPDGSGSSNSFFIGSNNSAQTGPSYISADDCGITTPTDIATIGFPNMHIILNVNGSVPGAMIVTQTAGLPSGSVFPVGTTTNTFQTTDGVGLTSTCSFTVTVVDNQNPVITCPANITVNTPAGSCVAVVSYSVTATDNCPGVTTALISGLASGSSFPIGTSTVSWRATDAAGNVSNCSFTVTVKDGQLPTITAQPVNQFGCVGGGATFNVTAITAPNAGGPLAYQWQAWNGSAWVNISGATTSSLAFSNLTLAMNTNSYRVQITGLCTTIFSNVASLYVNSLPTVSILASRTTALLPPESVNLTAVVNPGGGVYQWLKNNVVIPGATGASLNGLTVDDIGTYRVIYTDQNGCTQTSASIDVTGLASDKLYVYPNPNRGQFQVRFFNLANENVTVQIFDAKGAKILVKAVVSSGITYSRIDIDISSKPSGTYVCEVVNSAGKIIGAKKFVKHN